MRERERERNILRSEKKKDRDREREMDILRSEKRKDRDRERGESSPIRPFSLIFCDLGLGGFQEKTSDFELFGPHLTFSGLPLGTKKLEHNL